MLQLSSSEERSSDLERPLPPPRRSRRLWIAVGILVLLAIAVGLWTANKARHADDAMRLDISASPPPLPVLKQGFLPIDPAKAEVVNAGIPFSTAPLERSRPFVLPAVTVANLIAHQSAIDCLTAAIYYEAASESMTGQRAVAQVVLNRMRHPAFPKSVCGVVYEGSERRTGCQFSFTCDGSLARQPSQAGWARARGVAQAALAGYVEPTVGTATHYHTTYVVPYWAWSLDKITLVGAHIFYRWKGYWGRRAAFNGAYAGETVGDEQVPIFPTLLTDTMPGEEAAAVPLGPRPLADDIGSLGAGPAIEQAITAPVRADQETGALTADEKAGTLIHAGPKPSAKPTGKPNQGP